MLFDSGGVVKSDVAPSKRRAPSPRTCSLTKVVRVKIYRTKRRSESHISRNMLFDLGPCARGRHLRGMSEWYIPRNMLFDRRPGL